MKIIYQLITGCILLCIIVVSCKKLDTSASNTPSPAAIENSFFTAHRSARPVEQQLIHYLQRQNDQLNFVEKTVKQIGYPYWNKMLVVNAHKNEPGIESENNDTTTYYIPFVRDSQNYVNAAMAITTTATDTSFNYLCDWQYRYKINGSPLADTTAERYALFFMMLDKGTLGNTRFIIKDTALFNHQGRTHGPRRIVGIANHQNNGSGIGVENFVCAQFYYCDTPDDQACENGCDYMACPTGVCIGYGEYCSYEGPGGPGSGGDGEPGGPGGEPGGGGGTGGGTPPPPCGGASELRGVGTEGNLPCIEDPGWEPEPPTVPEPPAPNPCDAFIAALSANATFAANFKSLMSPANLSANAEKGYLINFTTGQFDLKQGQAPTNCTNCKGQVNLGTNTPINGTLHNHLNGSAAMFSPKDIVTQLAKNFKEGKAQDPNNLFIGVATANGPYLLKVVDTAKFRVMANKIYNAVNLKLQEDFESKNENNFNWATDSVSNEAGLLHMLNKFKKQGGLKLYKGNVDCTQWSALSVTSNTHNNQVVHTIHKQNCN